MPEFITDLGYTGMTIFWAVIFVAFLVAEASTAAMVSIWFAVGAFVAMFFAIFKFGFVAQLFAFVITSAIVLVLTRPLARRINNKKVPTNYELDVGKIAQVTETIDNHKNTGRVKLDGTFWAARSSKGDSIEEGSDVKVVEVDGAKLIVTADIN